MENAEIARVLEEIGRLIELRPGENPFKARAYRTAAATIRDLDEPVDRIAARNELESLPGVGAAIGEKIRAYLATGRIPLHERLRAEVPPGLIDIVAVPGLGVQRARAIHETLGVDSLDALEEAARTGRLARVPGLGPASVARILSGLERMRARAGRFRLDDAREAGARLRVWLQEEPAVERVEIAGSVRRACPVVHDVDLLVASETPGPVVERFLGHPAIAAIEARSDAAARARLADDVPADLVVVDPSRWPVALVRETGSAGHVARLEERAAARDTTLEALAADGEEALYAALDLTPVPPEMREDRGEVELAAGRRRFRLVERSDLRGVVHCHTDWSDGRATIREMAESARELGYAYLALCDHSRSSRIAGGLSIDRLGRQIEEIRRVDADLEGIAVLAGSEVDILPDGTLDYPDEVLAGLDVVVGSIHSAFRRPREEQTARLVRAFENRWFDVLGHPTGRLLLRRDGVPLDMERVLDAAAEHGVAIEINGNPRRLDLDWRWVAEAADRGILLSLNPDAHGPETIEPHHAFAVEVARKAGLAPEHVLNTREPDEFRASLRRNRA